MSYLRLLIFVRTNYVHCEKLVKLDAQLYPNLNTKVTRLQKIPLLIRVAKIARLIRMTSSERGMNPECKWRRQR